MAIVTLEHALAFPGISELLKNALYAELGTPTVVRDLSFIPRASWDSAVDGIRIDDPPRELNAIEVSKLDQFRRVCRLRTGLTPGDPAQELPAIRPAVAVLASTQGPPIPNFSARNLKLSHIIDPTLDAPLVSLSPAKVRLLFEAYALKQGAKPDRAVEPTQDQLSAVQQLLDSDHTPYVDFAIFGPYGKRMLERLTYYAFVSQPDGSWIRRELDGPNSFSVWWSSWRVLRTLLILLNVADPEHLDNYAEHIRNLDLRYGRECWFIIYLSLIHI